MPPDHEIRSLRLLTLSLLLASTSFGQVQSGRIVGTVTDPNRAAIPNATAAVTNDRATKLRPSQPTTRAITR